MSPRQVTFLTSQPEYAWSADEQRHFEGKPFEADVNVMPFYGSALMPTSARLQASLPASRARLDDARDLPRPRSTAARLLPLHRLTRSRSVSPPPRRPFDKWDAKCTSAEDGTPAATAPTSASQHAGGGGLRRTMATQATSIPLRPHSPVALRPSVEAPSKSSPQSPVKTKHRPNALNFLDADSPVVTNESITRVVAEASKWRFGAEQGFTTTGTLSSARRSLCLSSSSVDSDSSDATADDNSPPHTSDGHDSDSATSLEPSDTGDEGDAGSPTPKPTPTYDLEQNAPHFSAMEATPAALQAFHNNQFSTERQQQQQGQHQHRHQHNQPHQHQRQRQQQHSHQHHHEQQPQAQPQAVAHLAAERKYRAYRYGTPEMPRGSANLPHLPAGALNPRVPAAGHVKHLPRAEKLPLTGYELLASKLSSHSSRATKSRRGSLGAASTMSARSAYSGGACSTSGSSNGSMSFESGDSDAATSSAAAAQLSIKPLYRKFEALNHRILLHLQDELSELEEQLHRLDTADTQTRRLQNSIQPASRRAEASAGGELQWHKTDVLGKIGYKLGQYNHVLSSFTETQRLASPTLSDVHDYRTYLDAQRPITEIETRFLDASDDLVTLSPTRQRSTSSLDSPSSSSSRSEESLSPSYLETLAKGTLPPVPRPRAAFAILGASASPTPSSLSESSASSLQTSHSSRPVTAICEDVPLEAPKPVHGQTSMLLRPGLTFQEYERPPSHQKTQTLSAPGHTAWSSDDSLHLMIAMAVAVLVPVLTFAVMPGFVARMAVVLLVAFTVFGAQVQAGTVRVSQDTAAGRAAGHNLLKCAGVYGTLMAIVAGICT
ncbi:hypothetical protein SPI_02118 [Niveomyces insectorum RCEF 264]|uniref:DUF6594 domain-containing protein n=1 Tax=Niveomyces insectorum RCEF 264 TaxID=1081102 RepID=A0A167XSF6_9HYPO|nr:hypothetical protein SPI_02118 [Niveomyces insectorum RCEF 264]